MAWKFLLSSLQLGEKNDATMNDWTKPVFVVAISAIKLSKQFYIGGILNESPEFQQVFLPLQQSIYHSILISVLIHIWPLMEFQEGGGRKAAADVVDSCSSFLHSPDSSCDRRRGSNSEWIRTFFHELGRVCSSDVDIFTAHSNILPFTFSEHRLILAAISLKQAQNDPKKKHDKKINDLSAMVNKPLAPESGFVFWNIFISSDDRPR